MRFNFSIFFRSARSVNDSFYLAPSGRIGPSVLGLTDLSSMPPDFSTSFGKVSSPLSSDELVSHTMLFSERNMYLFEYMARRAVLQGKNLSRAFYTVPYKRYNSASAHEQAISNFILSKVITYPNSKIIFFRANGFWGGSFRIPFSFSFAKRYFHIFRFFRFFSLGHQINSINGYIFLNSAAKFEYSLRFSSFFSNFFKRTRKVKFYAMRRRFLFRSKSSRFSPFYYYMFYSYLSRFNPTASAKFSFFNFPDFYQTESLYFNKAFYIRKFNNQRAVFLNATH